VAPICEEVLFRGVIQRGYEQLGAWSGILIGGMLFVIFHQSLPQGLALIPLAFLLGYLTWRTDSLLSGIVVHVVNNALAALMIIGSVFALWIDVPAEQAAMPEINVVLCTLPTALLGLAMVIAGLRGIQRWAPSPPPIPRATLRPGFWPWLARVWPLLLILPLYLVAISAEAIIGRAPELLSMGRPVSWSAAPWDGPRTWTYEIRHAKGGPVGQARCSLTPEGQTFVLTCDRQQSAYELETDQGPYRSGDLEERLEARWRAGDLGLLSAERQVQVDTPGGEAVRIETLTVPDGDAVAVTLRQSGDRAGGPGGGAPKTVSLAVEEPATLLWPAPRGEPTVLESGEWPWRLSALPFSGFYSAQATLVDPGAFSEGIEERGPAAERTHVVVYGAEPIKTPAKATIAWRVQVGDDRVAWYESEPPYTLVALDNGVERWVLTSVE